MKNQEMAKGNNVEVKAEDNKATVNVLKVTTDKGNTYELPIKATFAGVEVATGKFDKFKATTVDKNNNHIEKLEVNTMLQAELVTVKEYQLSNGYSLIYCHDGETKANGQASSNSSWFMVKDGKCNFAHLKSSTIIAILQDMGVSKNWTSANNIIVSVRSKGKITNSADNTKAFEKIASIEY